MRVWIAVIGLVAAAFGIYAVALRGGRETEASGPPPRLESWAAEPPGQWPQLILWNSARFRGYPKLEGNSACLIQLDDGSFLAATALHVLDVGPPVPAAWLPTILEEWRLYVPQRPDQWIKATGLFGKPSAYREHGPDLLFLKIDAQSEDDLPVRALKVRTSLLKPGERIFVAAAPQNSDSEQKVYRGRAQGKHGAKTTAHLEDTSVDLEGFSGAPVVDGSGHLAGIMVGQLEPRVILIESVAGPLAAVR